MQTQKHLNPVFFQLACLLVVFSACIAVLHCGLAEIFISIRPLIQDTLTDFELWIKQTQAVH